MKKTVLAFIILAVSITVQAQNLQAKKQLSPQRIMEETKNNPLLQQPWNTPYQTPPFDQIKEEHYLPAIKTAIALAEKEIESITNSMEKPNFQNTIVALERSGIVLKRIEGIFFNMLSCNTNPNLQKMAEEISPILSHFSNSLYHNEKLFKRVEMVYRAKNDALDTEDKKLIEDTYKSFVNNGAKLSHEKKKQYAQLTEELSLLNLKFSKNVLESTNSFSKNITDKNQLKGIPDDLLQIAKNRAQEKEMKGYLFDLSTPSYLAIMKYAEDRELRKEFYIAYNQRGSKQFDNEEIIHNILKSREMIAQLLGFENYAEYALQDRMAKNSKNVFGMLDKMKSAALAKGKEEIAELTKFAQKEGFKEKQLQGWDITFYAEKYKNHLYNISDEQLQPYFVLENVIDGIFELSSSLFNLKYVPNKKIPTYHPDVKVYEVYRNKKLTGILYMDFHPRESKRSGAWMTSFREQYYDADNKYVCPQVSLVMNFSPSTKGKPSLLTYDEVQTFLHEFGHGLHGLLSDVKYESLSGTNVPRDFVEFPSQIMENWASEQEFLKEFAFHYKTKKVIPQELITKVKEAENFMSGYYFCRQLTYGYLDMRYHTTPAAEIKDVIKFEHDKTSDLQLLPVLEGTCMSKAFSHIFAGGYAAGYYSYKWSEVIEADAFELFQEQGIFNPKVANSYVDNILSKGGSEDAMKLYAKFRGREPSVKALLKRSNLIK